MMRFLWKCVAHVWTVCLFVCNNSSFFWSYKALYELFCERCRTSIVYYYYYYQGQPIVGCCCWIKRKHLYPSSLINLHHFWICSPLNALEAFGLLQCVGTCQSPHTSQSLSVTGSVEVFAMVITQWLRPSGMFFEAFLIPSFSHFPSGHLVDSDTDRRCPWMMNDD